MASNDFELIDEVRSFTGYTDSNIFSDSDIQDIVRVGKEELRSWLNAPEHTFYQTEDVSAFHADRALFWFVCIGLKVRAGEIGGVDLVIENMEVDDSMGEYNRWFTMFWSRLKSAETHFLGLGASVTQLTRDDERTYSYE